MVCAIVGFAGMGLIVRSLRDDIGPATAAFWRSIVGVFLVLGYAFVTQQKFTFKKELAPILLLRCVTGATALLFYFGAIVSIDLGTATALCYTYPVFATLLSAVYLKETVGAKRWMCIFISWIGIAIMTAFRPMIGLGEVWGTLSGILAGVAIHSLRALRSQGESAISILVIFQGFTSIVALPFAILEVHSSSPWWNHILALLLLGVTGTIGQTGLTVAYRYLRTQIASPLSFATVPLAAAGSYFIFDESIPLAGICGGAVLLLGLIGLGIFSETKSAKEIPGQRELN